MSTITEPKYDRLSKTWRLILPETGEVVENAYRPAVELAYLEAIAPTVAGQVRAIGERHPRLIDRARRAGLIVAAQGVKPGRGRLPIRIPFHQTEWSDEEVNQVKGSGYRESFDGQIVGRDWYSVTDAGNGALQCNCIDYADGSAPEILTGAGVVRCCKHILAVFISEPA